MATTLTVWYFGVLLVGLAAGWLINLCASRLTYEKSLFWPASRCPDCLAPLSWADVLPVVGWLKTGGKCRHCARPIPTRYLVVELLTAALFVALFHAVAVENRLEFPSVTSARIGTTGVVPPGTAWLVAHHAILLSFLLAASVCDLAEMEIPFALTLTGTLVGLALSALLPWPYPETIPPMRSALGLPANLPSVRGVYAWPVWLPLPEWLPEGSWRLGLATGLAGAVAGSLALRTVSFLFKISRGVDGLGVGDADMMMMAGAFIGWQPVVLAFFVAVFPAMGFAIIQGVRKGDQPFPFGPSLAVGVAITLAAWPTLGGQFQPLFFDPTFLGLLAVAGGVIFVVVCFLLRLLRGV